MENSLLKDSGVSQAVARVLKNTNAVPLYDAPSEAPQGKPLEINPNSGQKASKFEHQKTLLTAQNLQKQAAQKPSDDRSLQSEYNYSQKKKFVDVLS